MSLIKESDYKSSQDNDGFKYQEQLLVHMCLIIRGMQYQDFTVGYEVTKIEKFDDVVCGIKYEGTDYQIMLQAKHKNNKTKKTSKEKSSSSNERFNLLKTHLNKTFHITEYFRPIVDFKMKYEGDCELKYVLFTNYSIYGEELENLPEDQIVINKLFSQLVERGAKVSRLSYKCLIEIQNFINQDKELVNMSNSEKFADYVRDHLIFVTNCPDLEELKALNNEIFMKNFKVEHKETLGNLITKNVSQYIKCDPNSQSRRVIKKDNIERILVDSILQYQSVSKVSEEFLKDMPNIEFEEAVLETFFHQLRDNRVLCKRDDILKLTALKLFRSTEWNHPGALFVPLSKLTELQRFALKRFTNYVVIYVDEENIPADLLGNKKIIFVIKYNDETHNSLLSLALFGEFSFSDLSRETRELFLSEDKGIELQNYKITLNMIEDTSSTIYIDLMTDFFVKWFNHEEIKLGQGLPIHKLPKVCFDKGFSTLKVDKSTSTNKYVRIQESFNFKSLENCPFTIFEGVAQMGKTTYLLNLSIKHKEIYPHDWIAFIELRSLADQFELLQSSGTSDLTIEQTKRFLFDEIMFYRQDAALDRKLLDYYLTLKKPPLILIFDGFNDIMPKYETLAINLITIMVSYLKVKILVCGHLHLPSFSRPLHRKRRQGCESLLFSILLD